MTAPLAAQKPVLAGKPTKAAIEGRFYIEDVYPSVDTGRFAVKRIVGEPIEVWADVVRDGHDVLGAHFIWRRERERSWQRVPMRLYSNDRWTATFVPTELGRHVYAIEAWTDEFATWRRDFLVKRKAGQDLRL